MGLRKKKSLIDRANDYVESARPQIESAVASAKDRATPLLSEARDKAAPVISDARGKAAPLIADARERVGPVVSDARLKAGPVIAESAAVAADKAAIGAALAAEKAALGRDLAAAKAAELRKEGKKGGKLKKLLLFGGLAAAAGFAYKKLSGQSTSDNWQSSYAPTPAPSSDATRPVATEPADDSAGSSPDEALADSTGKPHPVSTPEDPAEVVSLEDESDASSKPSHKA